MSLTFHLSYSLINGFFNFVSLRCFFKLINTLLLFIFTSSDQQVSAPRASDGPDIVALLTEKLISAWAFAEIVYAYFFVERRWTQCLGPI